MTSIFLHGLGQDSSSFNKTINLLKSDSDKYAPDIFYLARGQLNYKNIYQGITSYLDNFSQPINLCGLSLGGILALNYAIDNPHKVKSLVLIGVQYKMPKTLLKIQNFIFRLLPNSTFKKIGISKADMVGITSSMMDLNFEEDLSKISCPTLVVCGENDKHNMKAAKEISQLIKNSKLKIIEGAGHEVNVDEPEGLAWMLDGFYEKRI